MTPLEIRQQHGDVVETATLASVLLDPVASKLSGDPSTVHRRCVIGRYLEFLSHPDGVRDDLAPFGSIEAVAVCEFTNMAVVVFWAEANVAIALERQAEASSPGWFAAVPPLDKALPHRSTPELIKAELYPRVPATGTPRRRPLFWFRNSPHEQAMTPPQRGPGTTWFTPSRESRAHGPVVGADGHLWMEGLNVQFRDEVPLGFWIDPTSIRVAPLDDGGGADPIPTYVPLFGTAATLTCVPQTGRLVPAATAMLSVPSLRELYGDVVEAATIARDLLSPMASQLSGDPSSIHRRCVLGWSLDFLIRPDGVRDDLAPFGAVEAVAVCENLNVAAIVFWAETSVNVTLGRQGEMMYGRFTAVPPLHEALPLCFLPSSFIQVALYPHTPATTTLAPPRPLKKHMFRFRDSPHDEPALIPLGGKNPGTTWFLPSKDSLLHGPVLGADDHLWIDGHNVICYEESTRIDPSWIRVTLLNSPGIYCHDAPTLVPFFSVSTR